MKSRADKGRAKKPNTKPIYTRISNKTYKRLVSEAEHAGKTLARVLMEKIEYACGRC